MTEQRRGSPLSLAGLNVGKMFPLNQSGIRSIMIQNSFAPFLSKNTAKLLLSQLMSTIFEEELFENYL